MGVPDQHVSYLIQCTSWRNTTRKAFFAAPLVQRVFVPRLKTWKTRSETEAIADTFVGGHKAMKPQNTTWLGVPCSLEAWKLIKKKRV